MVCDYSNDINKIQKKYKKVRDGENKTIKKKCGNCGTIFTWNSMNPLGHYKTKKCAHPAPYTGDDPVEIQKAIEALKKRDPIVMVYYSSPKYKVNRIVYIGDATLHKKYNKKQYRAVEKISNIYLDATYNPEMKMCRDRLDDLYDVEFDEDYVEDEKILLQPKDIYKKWYQNL